MLFSNKFIGTVAYLGGLPAILEEFVWSFAQMVQYNCEALCEPGQYIHYNHSKVSFHAAARNQLVNEMRGDWLLMLDTDHRFDPDICTRMIDRMNVYNVDVLTGLYQYKTHPHSPVLYMKCGELFSSIVSWRPGDKPMDLFSVDSTGGGCLLVKKSVYKRISDELHENPFDIAPPLGEDHSFFRRLEKLGVKVYCDPRIECNHLMTKTITMKDYDKTDLGEGEEMAVDAIKVV